MATDDDYYRDYPNGTSLHDNENNAYETFIAFNSVFLVCMYSFACIFGVSGNALVLIIFIFYEKVKVLTDVFLVSLAVADLCFLCTLPFWAYSAAKEWIFGTLPCQIIRGLYTLNLYGSMLTLTCLTIDRYFAIVQATKAHISQAKRIAWGKVVCVLVWVLSLLFALPQFLFSTQKEYNKKVCIAEYPSDSLQTLTQVIQLALGYFCPMLVMILCYSVIMNTLLYAKGFRKQKSLKIIFAIVVVFIFTQTPYNILKLIRAVDPTVTMDNGLRFDYVLVITEAIAYFHSCLNPLLYFFIGLKFRRNLANILKNLGCTKHEQIRKPWQTTGDDGSKSCTATQNAEETSMYPL